MTFSAQAQLRQPLNSDSLASNLRALSRQVPLGFDSLSRFIADSAQELVTFSSTLSTTLIQLAEEGVAIDPSFNDWLSVYADLNICKKYLASKGINKASQLKIRSLADELDPSCLVLNGPNSKQGISYNLLQANLEGLHLWTTCQQLNAKLNAMIKMNSKCVVAATDQYRIVPYTSIPREKYAGWSMNHDLNGIYQTDVGYLNFEFAQEGIASLCLMHQAYGALLPCGALGFQIFEEKDQSLTLVVLQNQSIRVSYPKNVAASDRVKISGFAQIEGHAFMFRLGFELAKMMNVQNFGILHPERNFWCMTDLFGKEHLSIENSQRIYFDIPNALGLIGDYVQDYRNRPHHSCVKINATLVNG